MATINRLTTAGQLIDNVPISKTVDQELLKKVIYNQQLTKTQGLLGTKLYDAIIKEAITDANIAGNRKILLDKYLKPALHQYAYRAAVLHLKWRVTDKGILEQSDANAAQADKSSLNHLRASILNDAQFHDNLAVKFICDNAQDFPEYNNFGNDGINPSGKPYFSGIVLD